MSKIRSVITGTGSYIPENAISGKHFLEHTFFDGGAKIDKENEEIIQKFSDITEINERRYINDDQLNHDIGLIAAQRAIEDAKIDKESLDYIIFCHNFGDIKHGSNRVDMLPALAAKVKLQLGISNPDCVAFDLIFGCPGWVQGMIQADYLIRSGDAKHVLVIGSETLSRIVDPHDRDSMIFADGAGATILSAATNDDSKGILAHKAQTHASHADMLIMGGSNNPTDQSGNAYIKMKGRKLYEFAVITVPQLVKQAIDKAGVDVKQIKMVFIHQANGKMDHAIMKRLFKLYGEDNIPEKLVPMTISWLGNSSVATVPTLIDLVLKNKMDGYKIKEGDYAVFASVGAGMHINAIVYKF
ncbi:3-oxoacyl-ACP synthase III family protein [Pedobacter nanyangensis]|uniref:3-oxoacyl-ACP synthase III family protein n=1 Tax=Pedobacter nanyangensis TaxID=1562389 RepID=UPI000DE3D2AA|nr:ketoacyl-ACP synthase III [Pedobacter nanyangensis]